MTKKIEIPFGTIETKVDIVTKKGDHSVYLIVHNKDGYHIVEWNLEGDEKANNKILNNSFIEDYI